MPARDWMEERRTVRKDGRRFTVRKPTCETIVRLMMLFGTHIGASRLAYRERPELFRDGAAVDAVLADPLRQPARVAHVLISCVEIEDSPEDLELVIARDPALIKALVQAALEVCDVQAIMAYMDVDGIADSVAADQQTAENPPGDTAETAPIHLGRGVDPFDWMLHLVCRFYPDAGLTPFDVMQMPYEAVQTIVRTIMPHVPGQGVDDDDPEVADGDTLDRLPGGGYERFH